MSIYKESKKCVYAKQVPLSAIKTTSERDFFPGKNALSSLVCESRVLNVCGAWNEVRRRETCSCLSCDELRQKVVLCDSCGMQWEQFPSFFSRLRLSIRFVAVHDRDLKLLLFSYCRFAVDIKSAAVTPRRMEMNPGKRENSLSLFFSSLPEAEVSLPSCHQQGPAVLQSQKIKALLGFGHKSKK